MSSAAYCCVYQFLILQKVLYLRGFLRLLDETFRIFRAIFDHYDPGVANIFEPQKKSYEQKYSFSLIAQAFFERDSLNFWYKNS